MNRSWDEIAELFGAASELRPEERSRFLDARCEGDVELRREIETLLDQDDAAGDYLTPPHVSERAGRTSSSLPDRLGEFRIVRRIGTGGMGSVFEAEQSQPQRRVALKMLAPFSDASSARRFSLEAQLLARMNHPSIAQVFAAGVDGDTPYLAMELVEGALPITDYVRANALTLTAALDLFRGVCAGIAHGHTKGVVHRDLKPSNVLIDRQGSPKVIDFGIGRALDAMDSESARMTRTGDLVGTLQYMSPEQAEGRIAQVDAQSDVHGLGLLLFEMLCGKRAFDLEGLPLTAALRKLAEHALPSVRSVAPHLPVEIDWIVRKALEKDRGRRYASVAELDADVERFLSHQPVSAGPPSRVYEARKFVRRHRVAVLALVAVFAALSIGLAAALRERSRAESARSDLSGRTRELEIETRRKDRMLEFQQCLLTAASADNEGYDVRVIDLLDIARSDLAALNEEPEVAIHLHASLGSGYASLGRYDDALAEYRLALELARSRPGIEPWRIATLERSEIQMRSDLQSDPNVIADARMLLERNRLRFGPSAPETILSGSNLSDYLRSAGSLAEAEDVARTALSNLDSSSDPATITTLKLRVAVCTSERGGYAEAISLLLESLDASRASRVHDDVMTMGTEQLLISLLKLTGDADELERVAASSVDVHTRRHGPDHALTLGARVVLSETLYMAGRREESMSLLEDVRARSEQVSAGTGKTMLRVRHKVAELMLRVGRQSEATAILRELLSQYAAKDVLDSPDALRSSIALANAYLNTREYDLAEPIARTAVLASESRFGRESRVTIAAYLALAQLCLYTERPSEAVEIIETNVEILRDDHGALDDFLSSLQLLGQALAAADRPAEAEQAIREALPLRTAHFGAADPRTRHARRALAEVLWASGRRAEAETELCELIELMRTVEPDPSYMAIMLSLLGGVRREQGRSLDSLAAFLEAHEITSRSLPHNHPTFLDACLNLASQWRRVGQIDRVPGLLEPIYDACLEPGKPKARFLKPCRSMLLKSYEVLGRTEEAKALRERIAAESKSP